MEMFRVIGVGPRTIRVVFSEPVLANSALHDPASYTVTEIGGDLTAVTGVGVEQPGNPTSILLTTGADLKGAEWYSVVMSPLVVTPLGAPMVPDNSTFQWAGAHGEVSIGLDQFTGEVEGGLYGNPLGLVFFSPALEQALANSVIEVDEVSVCTTAFDSYEPPSPIDPTALFTWGPNNPPTVLGQPGVVLWGSFPRLSDARFALTSRFSETVPLPEDGPATATFQEPWDHDYVALLNNPHWQLYPATGGGVAFITAANLTPIPPGPTVTVVLEP